MIGKLIEPGNGRPSGIYHDGGGSGYFAHDHAGPARFLTRNWATGTASAAIGAATGSDQSSLEIAIHDNHGKPFASYRYGVP